MSNKTAVRKTKKSVQSKRRTTDDMQPSRDFVHYLKDYAREKPDVAALWCFGIGFVVGWKLKPW